MTSDEVFLSAVETCGYPLAEFDHPAHVRLAWLYLNRHPLPEAMIYFRDTLKRFAERNGKIEVYHETITFAFLLLIHERLHPSPAPYTTWDQFAAGNDSLLKKGRQLLMNYYRAETLSSQRAKSVFHLPDRWAGKK